MSDAVTPALQVKGLTCRFGTLAAVDDVDMTVGTGEIRALIGPNGAGKTTLLHAISGFLRPSAGSVALAGRRLDRLAAHRRARLGMRRTFQTPHVCARLSVVENVIVGAHNEMGCSSVAAMVRLRRATSVAALRSRAVDALTRVGLAEHAERPASTLSYGQIRLLEIARTLIAGPSLLLLDEPVAGMNEHERAGVAAIARSLASDGVTVIVIEHDMPFVMGLADYVTVLDAGRVLAEGSPSDVQRDPAVEAVYLGAPDQPR